MNYGLYLSATGVLANTYRQDVIANNLANSETVGFKRHLATFQQRRVGVMGFAGGDSMEKMKADTNAIGDDIAKFLSAWATGKKLK